MLQSSKMTFLPRLNAFGSYELYDDTLLVLTQKDVVGAQLLWNVFDGYKSIGKMEKARLISKAEIEIQQYKAKSQLELNKANRQLRDAETRSVFLCWI
jgi:outer membrane protein TolC